jgi:hypothetical protein
LRSSKRNSGVGRPGGPSRGGHWVDCPAWTVLWMERSSS